MQNNLSASEFNIGTGVETSVNQIFNYLKEILNPTVENKYGLPKQGEQKRSVLDYARARKILYWEPLKSVLDNLKSTCEYFKKKSDL